MTQRSYPVRVRSRVGREKPPISGLLEAAPSGRISNFLRGSNAGDEEGLRRAEQRGGLSFALGGSQDRGHPA